MRPWPKFDSEIDIENIQQVATLLGNLTEKDEDQVRTILGQYRLPDLVIMPDGEPYLYRWELFPRNKVGANVYFHIQVADDPVRPPHDHPWDNTSVILSGSYDEYWFHPTFHKPYRGTFRRIVGDVIYRPAVVAHRLMLPADVPYTMTIFTTGPRVREWGFWYPKGWVSEKDVVHVEGRSSLFNVEGL